MDPCVLEGWPGTVEQFHDRRRDKYLAGPGDGHYPSGRVDRDSPDVARDRLGPGVAVQGNLDPAACLAPWDVVAEAARDVLDRNAGRPGHVFNLGHGVLPETNPDTLARLVELVHEEGRRGG